MPVIYFKPLISAPSLHYHFAILLAATALKRTKCGNSFHKNYTEIILPFFQTISVHTFRKLHLNHLDAYNSLLKDTKQSCSKVEYVKHLLNNHTLV